MEAYSIVRIVPLYVLAQDLAGHVPVSVRGSHKGGVELLDRLEHALASAATMVG
jgi:hypothetical protein